MYSYTSKNNLKVSIITVCLNAADSIEVAIGSVLSQTYPNIEYIIIDGDSTDQTLAIIDKYKLKITKIVSEKDKGVYDAMNKGVRLSSGEVLYFLNADDRFFDQNVIEGVVCEFDKDGRLGLLLGKVELINVPESELKKPKSHFTAFLNNKIDLLKAGGVCHQRVFAHKRIFDEVGLFDAQYQIFADIAWVLKALKHKFIFKSVDTNVVFYNYQGLSFSRGQGFFQEKIKAVYQNTSIFEFLIYFNWAIFRKFKILFRI